MNKHILFFLAKIIALFCLSFALVYVSNLLLDRSKDFSGLCRESIITTLPFDDIPCFLPWRFYIPTIDRYGKRSPSEMPHLTRLPSVWDA